MYRITMETIDYLDAEEEDGEEGNDLVYETFVTKYMKQNRPVIINNYIHRHWKCFETFRKKNGNINIEYLLQKFKDIKQVPVVQSSSSYDNNTTNMTFREFIKLIKSSSFNNETNNNSQKDDKKNNSFYYYLKDWHYCIECKKNNIKCEYNTPIYFENDWLNEWWNKKGRANISSTIINEEEKKKKNTTRTTTKTIEEEESQSDYKFLYLGLKNSYTPLHHDIFLSYSWSGQIQGRKKWYLYPPNQTKHLIDIHGTVARTGIWNDLSKDEQIKYPGIQTNVHPIIIIQYPNQLIFIPSGWYHEVYNIDETSLSINHNWFNQYNLPMVWNHLKNEWKDTIKAICDLKDIMDPISFQNECLKLMNRNTGINIVEFQQMLSWKINKQQVKVEEEVGEEADNSKSNFTSTTLNVNEIEVVENIITEIYELLLL